MNKQPTPNPRPPYYDFIGDIHGQYDKLIHLLDLLGYREVNGTHRHDEGRKVVFLGDYIDRGPRIRDTLHLARGMVEAGEALAIMGNHEFNAVAYAAPDPDHAGEYLRRHNDKHDKQHAATLREFEGREEEWADWLKWMRQLPMFLDLGGVRAVHASWAEKHLPRLAGTPLEDDAFLLAANRKGTPEYEAVETVLKGPELPLPEGVTFTDKEGTTRKNVRARWWGLKPGLSLGELVMPQPMELPITLEDEWIGNIPNYPETAPPVFFGHYWLPADLPRKPLGPNVVSLDYSGGLGIHPLTAYRWNGEALPLVENFVTGKELP